MACKSAKNYLMAGALFGASLLGSPHVLPPTRLRILRRGRRRSCESHAVQSKCGELLRLALSSATATTRVFVQSLWRLSVHPVFRGRSRVRDFGRARAKVASPGVGDVDFKTRAIFLEGVVTVPILNS